MMVMSNLSVEFAPRVVPLPGPPEGWYPDPMGRSALRLWSGLAWTWWTSNGTTVVCDPLPVLRSVGLDDLSHLMFVEQVFLPGVCASGAVTPRQLRESLHALTVRAGESTAGAAQTPGTATTTARSV